MNNILSQNNLTRIIIPTVFRDDYITALKAFSQSKKVEAIFKALNRASQISNSIPWHLSREEILLYLHDNSAFSDPLDSMWGLTPPYKKKENNLVQLELDLFTKNIKI